MRRETFSQCVYTYTCIVHRHRDIGSIEFLTGLGPYTSDYYTCLMHRRVMGCSAAFTETGAPKNESLTTGSN